MTAEDEGGEEAEDEEGKEGDESTHEEPGGQAGSWKFMLTRLRRRAIWLVVVGALVFAVFFAASESQEGLVAAIVGAGPPLAYFSWMLFVQRPDVRIGDPRFLKWPMEIWGRNAEEDPTPIMGGKPNARFLFVKVKNVGGATIRNCSLLVTFDGPETWNTKGRWATGDDPAVLDLHPEEGLSVALVRLAFRSDHHAVPAEPRADELRRREEGELQSGKWGGTLRPGGRYEIRVRVAGEDYLSPEKTIGEFDLPQALIEYSQWAPEVQGHLDEGGVAIVQTAESYAFEPDIDQEDGRDIRVAFIASLEERELPAYNPAADVEA